MEMWQGAVLQCIWKFLGYSQEEIGDKLSEKFHISYSNNQVSRCIHGREKGKREFKGQAAWMYDEFFKPKIPAGVKDEKLLIKALRTYLSENELHFDGMDAHYLSYDEFVKSMLGYGLYNVTPTQNEDDTKKEQSTIRQERFIFSRSELEPQHPLELRLSGATDIQLLNLAGTTLFYEKTIVADNHHKSMKKLFGEILAKGETTVRMILPKAGSIAEQDAAQNKLCESYDLGSSQTVLETLRNQIVRDTQKFSKLQVRFASCAFPYALMIVCYKNMPEKNHVKVDLYSPYLSRDSSRRTFMIYQNKDPDNFNFFYDNFQNIWGHSDDSPTQT